MSHEVADRVRVNGRYLYAGPEKLYVRGVTYGTFAAGPDGEPFPPTAVVADDFARMAELGVNAVRTYTVPSRSLLDIASRCGLRVMVGLTAERWLGRLLDGADAREVDEAVRADVAACAGHPAVLAYAIGNEFPATAVRWLGRRRVEQVLRSLYEAAKLVDPAALVTYANYPSTEYLDLDFLDFACFNVFLEDEGHLDAYLKRLNALAGERPLVIGEMGLDSQRHGEAVQASSVASQLRTTLRSGAAGAFVFAWTDDWHTSAGAVRDWDFGLVRRDRTAKPAAAAVRAAFRAVPFARQEAWPKVSVIVCSYNGARTIGDCLDGLTALAYPNYEAIVVDDGSTDGTAAIASRYPVRLIRTAQAGLSSARNTGLAAASGEIVAYIDDDARPDPDWLSYIGRTLATTSHAGVGGPSIAPAGHGIVSDCVARSPGNPTPVLLSDGEAEHVAGCNMAFRRSSLEAIGGFDPRFRTAGDDVDVCWRLRDAGFTLGFDAGAVVWHRARSTVGAYWRQQRGYGRAEALLEEKWPERYNAAGHTTWAGRIYGRHAPPRLGRAARVYQGIWGMAPFQRLYQRPGNVAEAAPLMPEWYVVLAGLLAITLLSPLWPALLLAGPLLAAAVAASLVQAFRAARAATRDLRLGAFGRPRRLVLITALHLLQPAARLRGRLDSGLTPWRQSGEGGASFVLPRQVRARFWSERWQPPEAWIRSLRTGLAETGAAVVDGGAFDGWDLEARGGALGAVRLLIAVEEHGGGRQLIRVRGWPRPSRWALVLTAPAVLLAAAAAMSGAWSAAAVFGLVALALVLRTIGQAGAATQAVRRGLDQRAGSLAVSVPAAGQQG